MIQKPIAVTGRSVPTKISKSSSSPNPMPFGDSDPEIPDHGPLSRNRQPQFGGLQPGFPSRVRSRKDSRRPVEAAANVRVSPSQLPIEGGEATSSARGRFGVVAKSSTQTRRLSQSEEPSKKTAAGLHSERGANRAVHS